MQKVQKLSAAKALLLLFFVFALFLPIARMFTFMAGTDVGAVLRSERFATALKNSLSTSLVATLVSVTLGMALAFCTERVKIKGRGVFTFMFLVPMLMPSISIGMGLMMLFGRNGLLSGALRLNSGIYGFWGIVAGASLYSFPVAYMMISDVIRYEDSRPYEAAESLGIPRSRRFARLFLPYIRKPLISVLFSVFTMVVTDYGVPLMIGGRRTTLPVMMYEDVIGMLDFGKGSVIGSVLLIPAVIAFILDTMNRDRASQSFDTRRFAPSEKTGAKAASYFLCATTSLVVVLPALSFLLISLVKKYPIDMRPTFDNFRRTFGMNAGRYLANSLLVSFCTAALGTAAAFVLAYLTARMKSRSSRPLHLCAITTLAVPGLVLGLSYALFFRGSPVYGTFAMLILVNMVHFFSSPYLMMYNTLGKLNPNLELVGDALDIPRRKIITGVLLPQSRRTMAEMFLYFFVNCMMTISAVSFLSTTATRPLSLMIPAFEGQMLVECASVVSLIILFVNLLMKFCLLRYDGFTAQKDGT